MKQITTQLPDEAFNVLRQGCAALLLTVDEAGFPHSAYTWAVAKDTATIRFGLEHETSTMTNLTRTERASLHIMAPGNLLFLVKGTPRELKSQIEAAPFKISLMVLEIIEVKDQTWPGVSVQPLSYLWSTERRGAMIAMEQAVYAEMREYEAPI